MRRYKYIFRTIVHFEREIKQHYFQLRTFPYNCQFQQVDKEDIAVSPCENLMYGEDAFGNKVQSGFVLKPHDGFEFISTGVVTEQSYLICEDFNSLYLIPSGFTKTNLSMQEFLNGMDLDKEPVILNRALKIAEAIYGTFSYEKGITTTKTSAIEAFELKKGVCQDFSHTMIALCRLAKIPARYVNGFILGEGSTHAWVEVFDSGVWYGIDPTHNILIENGYIKVAHGRDFADCTMDKGIFLGCTEQKVDVFLNVQEI